MKQPEPLSGKSVVITRPLHQASSFSDKLSSLGAKVISIPSICLKSNLGEKAFVEALENIADFDWIIFTSVNGVQAVLDQLKALQISKKMIFQAKLAAIGPATRNALLNVGAREVTMPDDYVSEAIVPTLGNISGMKILLPRADISRKDIVPLLQQAGASVTQVAAYRIESNLDQTVLNQLEEIPASFIPDYLTFTSSSTFKGCKELLDKAGKNWLESSKLIAIGPITAKTMLDMGFTPAGTATNFTTDGIVDVLVTSRSEHA